MGEEIDIELCESLAMLRLEPGEKNEVLKALDALLHMARELGEPTVAPTGDYAPCRLREDVPGQTLSLEEVLRNAGSTEGMVAPRTVG